MKKLFLFILPILILASCKDDKGETPIPIPDGELSQMLQGKWMNHLVKREYYGDADTIVYADSARVQATFEFKGDKMMITIPGSTTPETWTYALPDKEEPNYITLTKGDRKTDYMIMSISDTAMAWQDQEAWAGYPIHVPDKDKKTSKVGVYTYRFRRAN